jgi:cytochrome c556
MKSFFGGIGVFTAIMAGSVLVATASIPMDITRQEMVDSRVAGMKSLIGSMKGASEATDPAVIRDHLAKAIAVAKAIPSKFPKGTGIGDAGVTKTRAVQDIWTKPAEFKAATDGFVAALEAANAAAGDAAKFGAAMGGVKKSCSSCHDAFRGPATD